ncbi:MAG: tetratricopeptide repeat protein [Nocardioidaceae bacterium]
MSAPTPDVDELVSSLWDFEDAAASEARFRSAASRADCDTRLVLLTQVARAVGLQERYTEGHAELDAVEADADADASPSPEVAVRLDLERGRLLRSAGQGSPARALFSSAVRRAAEAGLDALHVDALHMRALTEDSTEDRVQATEEALRVARASASPRARDWDASLLNNLGMARVDLGDLAGALATFEEALAARERIGKPRETRVARWMVAWCLRLMGRTVDALEMQLALKADLDAAEVEDPYVDEELALLQGGA